MEVLPPLPVAFLSAPSSPTRITGAPYRSAPSGPPRISDLLLDDIDADFAFHVTADPDNSLFFAEELFDGGMIKAARPLPSPPSPPPQPAAREDMRRGRGKGYDVVMSRSGRRGARSLSPVRSGKDLWREAAENRGSGNAAAEGDKIGHPEEPALSACRGPRKWSLKDLLFRSASEGHATDKHAPRYGAGEVHSRRVDAPARKTASSSAHERHYIWKRAAAEDMKKKTFLPYKQGIFGRFSFISMAQAPARQRG